MQANYLINGSDSRDGGKNVSKISLKQSAGDYSSFLIVYRAECDMTSAYEKAIDLLSRREHSRLELKQKLLQRDFCESEINDTLNKIAERNFQSDERFAQCYVIARKKAGFGPLKISAELHERGVAESIISAAINMNENEWREQIIAVWRKKFSHSSKDKAAQFRFLSSRGFSSDAINRLLFSIKEL